MCKQGPLPPTASPIINKKAIQTFRGLGRVAFRKKLMQHAIFYSGDKVGPQQTSFSPVCLFILAQPFRIATSDVFSPFLCLLAFFFLFSDLYFLLLSLVVFINTSLLLSGHKQRATLLIGIGSSPKIRISDCAYFSEILFLAN